MIEDALDHGGLGDEAHHAHLASAARTHDPLLGRGLAPVAAGLAVGVAVAVGAAWGLSGFFTGIWPIDLGALLVAVSPSLLTGRAGRD